MSSMFQAFWRCLCAWRMTPIFTPALALSVLLGFGGCSESERSDDEADVDFGETEYADAAGDDESSGGEDWNMVAVPCSVCCFCNECRRDVSGPVVKCPLHCCTFKDGRLRKKPKYKGDRGACSGSCSMI